MYVKGVNKLKQTEIVRIYEDFKIFFTESI